MREGSRPEGKRPAEAARRRERRQIEASLDSIETVRYDKLATRSGSGAMAGAVRRTLPSTPVHGKDR